MFVCVDFGGSIDIQAITNFIDGGGNVLVAASSSIGKLDTSLFHLHFIRPHCLKILDTIVKEYSIFKGYPGGTWKLFVMQGYGALNK